MVSFLETCHRLSRWPPFVNCKLYVMSEQQRLLSSQVVNFYIARDEMPAVYCIFSTTCKNPLSRHQSILFHTTSLPYLSCGTSGKVIRLMGLSQMLWPCSGKQNTTIPLIKRLGKYLSRGRRLSSQYDALHNMLLMNRSSVGISKLLVEGEQTQPKYTIAVKSITLSSLPFSMPLRILPAMKVTTKTCQQDNNTLSLK